MRAGLKNRRITLRAPTTVADTSGGRTETMADLATVWANANPLDGNERTAAMQIGMTRPHVFTISYRTDVSGATEVVYGGRTFNVTSVTDPGARHRDLEILADEVQAP